jgi:hypothetical protein
MIYLWLNNYVLCNERKNIGVFQFDTVLVRHCYLLLALTYIIDVMVIIK